MTKLVCRGDFHYGPFFQDIDGFGCKNCSYDLGNLPLSQQWPIRRNAQILSSREHAQVAPLKSIKYVIQCSFDRCTFIAEGVDEKYLQKRFNDHIEEHRLVGQHELTEVPAHP